jgi:hypothetical protein
MCIVKKIVTYDIQGYSIFFYLLFVSGIETKAKFSYKIHVREAFAPSSQEPTILT